MKTVLITVSHFVFNYTFSPFHDGCFNVELIWPEVNVRTQTYRMINSFCVILGRVVDGPTVMASLRLSKLRKNSRKFLENPCGIRFVGRTKLRIRMNCEHIVSEISAIRKNFYSKNFHSVSSRHFGFMLDGFGLLFVHIVRARAHTHTHEDRTQASEHRTHRRIVQYMHGVRSGKSTAAAAAHLVGTQVASYSGVSARVFKCLRVFLCRL